MNSAETIERVPIHTDAGGVVPYRPYAADARHHGRGVRFWCDRRGDCQQYSSISLADVYSLAPFRLRDRD
jgi:hypothetical protein